MGSHPLVSHFSFSQTLLFKGFPKTVPPTGRKMGGNKCSNTRAVGGQFTPNPYRVIWKERTLTEGWPPSECIKAVYWGMFATNV